MRDIVWTRKALQVLLDEGMLDELTAQVAQDWAAGRSVVWTSLNRNISERTVRNYRNRIRATYDSVAVYAGLPPRNLHK